MTVVFCPSRKILNDLSSADAPNVAKIEEEPADLDDDSDQGTPTSITIAGTTYATNFPTG